MIERYELKMTISKLPSTLVLGAAMCGDGDGVDDADPYDMKVYLDMVCFKSACLTKFT
jgi:hypothetical protein